MLMQWLLEAILGYSVNDSIMVEDLDRWCLYISSYYIPIKN